MLEFSTLSTYQKISYVFLFVQAVIGFVGISSNVLTISVFSRKRFRKNSYSFYSRAMALNDIALLLHTVRRWAAFVLDSANLDLVAPFFCIFDDYSALVSNLASLWFLTLISADRLFSVVFPNRFKPIKHRAVQSLFILAIFVYSSCIYLNFPLNAQFVWSSQRSSIENNLTTSWYSSSALLAETSSTGNACFITMDARRTNSIIGLANLVLVNLVVNNFLNFRIIMFISGSSRKVVAAEFLVTEPSRKASNNNNNNKIDRRFAISSVGLNLCALVLKIPHAIGCIVCYYFSSSLGDDLVQAVFTITLTLMMIQNSVAFLVNMLTNPIFYTEFFYMIGIGKPILTITDSNILTRQKIVDSVI